MSDVGTRALGEGAHTFETRVIGGRYRVMDLLGRGSMGSVYRAQHTLTHQQVALKLITPTPSSQDLVTARFQREVKVSAHVRHDGIVQVIDAGQEPDGTLFLAMELLSGETFQARAGQAGFTPAYGLQVIRALLAPLAAAHHVGIVHRDIKPDNTFLHRRDDGREQVKLLDFGIARDPRLQSSTRTDVGLGTPFYMSPEQATSAKDVTPASDVWSVGVMMYWLLSGRLPFEGETPYNTLTQVCTAALPPLEATGGQTTQRLVDLVQATLHKAPEYRPQDAGQLIMALNEILGPESANESFSAAHYGSNPNLQTAWTAPVPAARSLSGSLAPLPPAAAPVTADVPAAAMASLTFAAPPAQPQRRLVALAIFLLAFAVVCAGILAWRARRAPVVPVVAVEALPRPQAPAPVAPPPVLNVEPSSPTPPAVRPKTRAQKQARSPKPKLKARAKPVRRAAPKVAASVTPAPAPDAPAPAAPAAPDVPAPDAPAPDATAPDAAVPDAAVSVAETEPAPPPAVPNEPSPPKSAALDAATAAEDEEAEPAPAREAPPAPPPPKRKAEQPFLTF